MLKAITSFGFRQGVAPQATPSSLVIDVRTMFRNPYHNKAIKHLNGTHPLVQEDIMKTPNFIGLYEHLKQQVQVPGLEHVYIGCTGGHHRSVFLAEKLGKELGVEVVHRDLHKP